MCYGGNHLSQYRLVQRNVLRRVSAAVAEFGDAPVFGLDREQALDKGVAIARLQPRFEAVQRENLAR
jgi:hypothetical protein